MDGVTRGGYYHVEKKELRCCEKSEVEYYVLKFNPPSTSSIAVDAASSAQDIAWLRKVKWKKLFDITKLLLVLVVH